MQRLNTTKGVRRNPELSVAKKKKKEIKIALKKQIVSDHSCINIKRNNQITLTNTNF